MSTWTKEGLDMFLKQPLTPKAMLGAILKRGMLECGSESLLGAGVPEKGLKTAVDSSIAAGRRAWCKTNSIGKHRVVTLRDWKREQGETDD